MEPGDTIYFPGGTPHAALNMDKFNLAYSMNFLDKMSLKAFQASCKQPLWRDSTLCFGEFALVLLLQIQLSIDFDNGQVDGRRWPPPPSLFWTS